MSYTAILSTDDGQSWLTASPTSGSIAAGGTNAVTLSATVTSLGTGLRHGTVRLVFSDGSIQTVDVQLAVSGASSGTGVRSCGSSDLALAFLAPQQNFQTSAQVPIPLQVLVQDCNGNLLTSSNTGVDVLVGSSTTDIRLNYAGNGVWAGTWTPGTASAATSLQARAIELVGGFGFQRRFHSRMVLSRAALPNAPPLYFGGSQRGQFRVPRSGCAGHYGLHLRIGSRRWHRAGVLDSLPEHLQGAQFSVNGVFRCRSSSQQRPGECRRCLSVSLPTSGINWWWFGTPLNRRRLICWSPIVSRHLHGQLARDGPSRQPW